MVGSTRTLEEGPIAVNWSRFLAAVVCAGNLLTQPGLLFATEFGATHLVFEKATKMKKIKASLYMSFLDRSVKTDTASAGRRLRCAVASFGKRGPLTVGGKLLVRLLGEERGNFSSWRGTVLSEAVDAQGEARFDQETISGLVAEAFEDNVDLTGFRIDFVGGKGKKATQVTLDCVHELTGG